MEKEFTNIYNTNHWGNDNLEYYRGSSGPGSEIWYNVEYIPFLQNFIIQHNIQNVVDIGCGNCKCLNQIYDILDIKYYGYDCYKDIILYNVKFHSNDKYNFIHLDVFNSRENICNGDICIVKDVLMHWKLIHIYEFLNYLVDSRKFKYILIINCASQNEDDTDILVNGNWRPLSANFYPLKKYNCKIVGSYNAKEISLISL